MGRKKRPLTVKQKNVLDFIQKCIEEGNPPPSQREIADHFGFKSKRAAVDHVTALCRKGYLIHDSGKARAIRLTEYTKSMSAPFPKIPVLGSIRAGFPTDAQEETASQTLTVDTVALGYYPGTSVFALEAKGNSMVGRGINDGDWVIMDSQIEPNHGDIVAALIDGESTLKTFVKIDNQTFLKAENPQYPNLVPLHDLTVQGVARTIIHKLR